MHPGNFIQKGKISALKCSHIRAFICFCYNTVVDTWAMSSFKLPGWDNDAL